MISKFDNLRSLLKRFFYRDYLKTPESILDNALFFLIYNKEKKYGYVIGSQKEAMNELLHNYEIEIKPGLKEFIDEIKLTYAIDINSLSTNVYKFYLKRSNITNRMRDLYTVREEINEDTTTFYYDVELDTITHYKQYLVKQGHHINKMYKVGNPNKPMLEQKCNIVENTHIYFKDDLNIVPMIDMHKYYLSCSYRDGEDKTYLYIRKRGKK
jgi:hypothetical protein